MAYVITLTDGTIYTVLGDGVLDNTLGISLIGQNFQNYGQLIANNFVHLLENFSNSVPPTNPIAGQLWWNSAEQVLSFYDGDKFKPCSSSELGPTPPPAPLDGDQWWNILTNQLNVFNGDEWMVIGPNYAKGQGFSGLTTVTVTDTSSYSHVISTLQSNAQIVAIVNSDPAFTLSSSIANISSVGTGITFTPNAVLTGNVNIDGGTIDSTVIGSITPTSASFTTSNVLTLQTAGNLTVLSNLIIGHTGNTVNINYDTFDTHQITSSSAINIQSGNTAIKLDSTNGTVTLNQLPTISTSITTKNYVDTAITNSIANSELYTDSSITSLIGNTAPLALSTLSGLSSAIDNDPFYYINTNASIGFKANAFNSMLTGTTTISADLAEIYTADAIYSPGTVVVFGGTQDITVSGTYCDQRIAGIISASAQASVNLSVSLTGKALCNVIGPVTKGDILVNSVTPGYAIKIYNNNQWLPGCVVGKSLVTDNSAGTRTIMISVGKI